MSIKGPYSEAYKYITHPYGVAVDKQYEIILLDDFMDNPTIDSSGPATRSDFTVYPPAYPIPHLTGVKTLQWKQFPSNRPAWQAASATPTVSAVDNVLGLVDTGEIFVSLGFTTAEGRRWRFWWRKTATGATGNLRWFLLRYDTYNHVSVRIYATSIELVKRDAGTATTLGTYTITDDTSQHELYVERVGGAWRVYLDGSLIIDVADNFLPSTPWETRVKNTLGLEAKIKYLVIENIV